MSVKTVCLLCVCLGFVFKAQVSCAEIYRWVDDAGTVHFSDQRASEQAEEVVLDVRSVQFVTITDLPERPKARSATQLIMYSTQRCGVCHRARDYFLRNGIAFIEKDIEDSASARAEFDALGGVGVPLLVLANRAMNGFSAEAFQYWYDNSVQQ